MRELNITIRRGETVALPIRIESDVLTYKTITAIAQSGPASITAASHGCPDGWRAAVMNAKGMTEINAANNPPKDSELRRVTVVDANTIEFNKLNSAGFRAYTSGGQLVYYKPLTLGSYNGARIDFKDQVGGTVLLSVSTTAGSLELDQGNTALWLRLTDEETAAIDFDSAVFDIELLDGAGTVTAVCSADSTLTVLPEVTTST